MPDSHLKFCITHIFGYQLIFIIYIVFLIILYNVLNSIYVAALYHFATTGEVRGGFSEETIQNAGLL